MEFDVLFRLVSVMNGILIISHPFDKKRNFNTGLYSDIYRQISFKLGMITEKFSMLPHSVGLLNLMLNSFCTSNMQGKELFRRDFFLAMCLTSSCVRTL